MAQTDVLFYDCVVLYHYIAEGVLYSVLAREWEAREAGQILYIKSQSKVQGSQPTWLLVQCKPA